MQVPQLRVTRLVTLLCSGLLACDTFGPQAPDSRFTGIDLPCDGADSQQSIGWEESSLLGVPAVRFAAFEGQCEAPLRLNTTKGDLAPSRSTMQVEVQLDHETARLVEHTDNGNVLVSCPPELVVDANVHLVSDDGLFDVSTATSVSFRSDTPTRIAFTTPLHESKGTFEPTNAAPRAKTTLSFELEGPGESCAGEISATIVTESPGGSAGSHGPIGAWSATECGLGERQFDPAQKLGSTTLPRSRAPSPSNSGSTAAWGVSRPLETTSRCTSLPARAMTPLTLRGWHSDCHGTSSALPPHATGPLANTPRTLSSPLRALARSTLSSSNPRSLHKAC